MTSKNRREEFAAGLVKDGERSARKYLRRAADDQEAAELVGKTIVFEYPRHNFEHVPLDYRTRIFRVDDAREFGSDPNDEPAAERNPHLRRRGKLLLGVDLACGEARNFYRGAMRNVHAASAEEVAALAPVSPVVIVDRPKNWKPGGVNDVPPSVTVHHAPSRPFAIAFANAFNGLELSDSTGRWAVR